MKKKGVSEDAIKKQIEATLGWQKVIQKKYRNQLEIRQSDIDFAKEKIKKNQGKTEYFLSEILLFVNTPQQEEAVKSNANTIYQQLKNGAKFEGVARQFSQSATAANGGAIGWLITEQLPNDARKTITQMEKNTFTMPIRTQLGYKIYKLNDVRLAGVLQSNNTTVDLFQTIIKFVNDKQAQNDAQTVIDNVTNCETAEENAKKNGYTQSGYSKNVAVNKMQKIVQEQVAKLKINQTTKPIPIDDNIVFMTLCKQSAPSYSSTVVDPDNENIKRTLFSERATQLSQKLLQIEREGLIITKSD
jgi:peptidyl-prolyl cis-trans isomerase SurA